MGDDVRYFKKHNHRLFAVAATTRKVININFKKLTELESIVHEILQ